MYIIDVIPLTFIPRNQAQILSYFNNEPLSRGTVVEILISSRKIRGVVIDSDSVKNRKFAFRKSVEFKLKKVLRVVNPEPQVSNYQLRIAHYLSSYYYAPLGISLKTVLPPFWGKRGYKLQIQDYEFKEIGPEVSFVSMNLKNHDLDFENKIEGAIKRDRQVFLMTPENTSSEYFLNRYAKFNPFFISSGIVGKKYFDTWQKVQSGEAKLIIGTRIGLFMPFSNLGLIIVDDESNENYKSDRTPRYNASDAVLEIAKLNGAKILYCAAVPRLETWFSQPPAITNHQPPDIIINMTNEIKSGNFSVFSRDLKDALLNRSDDNIILFVPRRGYANFLLCQKCGQTIKCPDCSASLVIHNLTSETYNLKLNLICHHCNHIEPKPKLCPACESYKIKLYGVGTQKVVDEIYKLEKRLEIDSKYNPEIKPKKFKVFRLDSDVTQNNDEKETKIIEDFKNARGAILVTTQIIFSHKYSLTELRNPPVIGIINADTLINFPDFRAEESLFRQIYTLGRMASRLLIQTYNPKDEAIKSAASRDIKRFFSKELENRKAFSYPPFSKLIKLIYKHKDLIKAKRETRILYEKLAQAVSQLKTRGSELKAELLGPSPAFISKERSEHIWNIILKIKNHVKSQSDYAAGRNDLLRFVPSGWTIDVDPRNII